MKFLKRLIWPALTGFIIGLFMAAAGGEVSLANWFLDHAVLFSMGLLIISAAGLFLFLFFAAQIKHIQKRNAHGAEEDEAGRLIDRKYCDLSTISMAVLAISILNACIAFLKLDTSILTILTYLMLVASFIFLVYVYSFARTIHPERKIPGYFEADVNNKLMEVMDEGEKHMMLGGLYKAYQWMNGGLIVSLALLVFYSHAAEHSQMFAIILISILLLAINTVYLQSLRAKT